MTTGLEEMLANIHKLQVNNRRVAREAVSEGADMFAQQLESNTPDDSGVLKSDVMVSGFKGGGQGQIEKTSVMEVLLVGGLNTQMMEQYIKDRRILKKNYQ